jgi:hypothetical protein
MAYCSVADLVARFSETEIAQLTDVEDRETVNDAVALAAITEAGGVIDSYLGAQYALPIVDAVPAQVTYVGGVALGAAGPPSSSMIFDGPSSAANAGADPAAQPAIVKPSTVAPKVLSRRRARRRRARRRRRAFR